jgi:hypothetical protein
MRYTIERYDAGSKAWQTICDQRATDADDPWADPQAAIGVHYRVTAFNADDVASPVSSVR